MKIISDISPFSTSQDIQSQDALQREAMERETMGTHYLKNIRKIYAGFRLFLLEVEKSPGFCP